MNPSRVRETGRVVQKEKIQIQLKFNPGQPYRSKMATSPAPAQTSGESTKKWVLPGDRPAENVQSQPKDREAEQARPRQQPNTAARMVAVVVFARDQGDNEGEGGEGEGGPLAPEFHAAEGPRQKNQQCDHDGDHAPFQRMQCILLGLGTKSGGRTDGVALAGGGIHTPQHAPPRRAGKRGHLHPSAHEGKTSKSGQRGLCREIVRTSSYPRMSPIDFLAYSVRRNSPLGWSLNSTRLSR